MNGQLLRVGIYARVSTLEQTVDNQLIDLRAYSQQRGWTVAKEYFDSGISGAKCSRPSLDQMMKDARQRKFDVVLVWRFDRFARSTTHLLHALEEFRSLGIEFCSYNEGIDTSTPMGKMIFTVVSAVAELERTIIIERVKAGVRRAKAQGKTLGRPKVTIDLPAIQRMRSEGLSVRAIAKQMKVSHTTIFDVLKKVAS